jgi:hypothetical protein
MYPVAPGHPDYTAAGAAFIPELWIGKLLEKLYMATVFGEISNTDYEGKIKSYGDTVIVRTTPDITINDYVIGQNLTYQRPESLPIEMKIDQGKYFAFTCDDVIAKQSDIKLMSDWSDDGGRKMAIAIDANILAYAYPLSQATYNIGNAAGKQSGDILLGASGAPLQLTKTNILEVIVDCGLVLDEQEVPETGRWLVLPKWAIAMLSKSDLKDASMTGEDSVLPNGRIGRIARFTIYGSSNLTTVAAAVEATGVKCWQAMFGHPMALSFASQLTKMETLRAESTFGDLVRSLNIFGRKVFHPEALGTLYIYKG